MERWDRTRWVGGNRVAPPCVTPANFKPGKGPTRPEPDPEPLYCRKLRSAVRAARLPSLPPCRAPGARRWAGARAFPGAGATAPWRLLTTAPWRLLNTLHLFRKPSWWSAPACAAYTSRARNDVTPRAAAARRARRRPPSRACGAPRSPAPRTAPAPARWRTARAARTRRAPPPAPCAWAAAPSPRAASRAASWKRRGWSGSPRRACGPSPVRFRRRACRRRLGRRKRAASGRGRSPRIAGERETARCSEA